MKSGSESRYLEPDESFLCAGALPLLTARLWGGGASVIKAAQVILFSPQLLAVCGEWCHLGLCGPGSAGHCGKSPHFRQVRGRAILTVLGSLKTHPKIQPHTDTHLFMLAVTPTLTPGDE